MLLFQESHRRTLEAVSDSSESVNIFGTVLSCNTCWGILRSSCNHARTQIDLGLRVQLLHRLHLPSCGILLTSLASFYSQKLDVCAKQFAKIKKRIHRHWTSYFQMKVSECNACSSFGTSFLYRGPNGLKHHPSSTFRRKKLWQNLIDVAEFDRNVTKRVRSKQNVASRGDTYNYPW